MALITEGLYQIILEQSYGGQTVLNRFWYENTLGSDDEQDKAAEAFDEDVLPGLSLIQNTGVSYVKITAKNVTGDLADHVMTPTTTAGTLVGNHLPSFIAASYRLHRTTKETRNGGKRFCGAREEDVAAQLWIAAYFSALGTFAGVLIADISVVGGIFSPVIGRFNPLTPTQWTSNPIATASASQIVSSQVSRKQGVGA